MNTCLILKTSIHSPHLSNSQMEKIAAFQHSLARLPSLNLTNVPSELVSGTQELAIDVELFRLATSIFLARTAGSLGERPSDCLWTDMAFELLPRMRAYNRRFPLLVFGLEAQTDSQRIIILDLISRSEQAAKMRNLEFVVSLVQSSWIQDDLAENSVDYFDKLCVLISCSEHLPTFV
jgi:hypothetical protein